MEALKLKEGDDIEITGADERAIQVRKEPGREELVRRLSHYRGMIPADLKFDRSEIHD